MTFHILPAGIPTVLFAHTYATDNYHIFKDACPNYMEITYFECGESYCAFADGTRRYNPPESVGIYTAKQPMNFTGPAYHRHCTVAFSMPYGIVSGDTADALHLDDQIAGGEFVANAAKIIRACAHDILLERDNPYKTAAHIFELFALYQRFYADNAVLSVSSDVNHGAIRYVKQAKEYILRHIADKLTVAEIADALHLSRGYLSEIFKTVSGMSLIRYVNEVRLETVKNLVLKSSASLAEACAFVGVSDPNYISRMFRKYYGTTISNLKSSPR